MVLLLGGLEYLLQAEAPSRFLYTFKQPHWALPSDGFVGMQLLVLLLNATLFFRGLAGFRFPVNRAVLTGAVVVPALVTLSHLAMLKTGTLWALLGGYFVLALISGWLTARSWTMDKLSGVIAALLPIIWLAGIAWVWTLLFPA
jgi:hypothetical protein